MIHHSSHIHFGCVKHKSLTRPFISREFEDSLQRKAKMSETKLMGKINGYICLFRDIGI